jgi:RNA polymerase sigma-70 factor (ECF subfamily)
MPLPGEWPLERYRPLLRLLVRQQQLDPRLRTRFDSSDVVQETLARALEKADGFHGSSEAELVRWLQEILAHVLVDKVREAQAKKRDVRLEQSLHEAVAESSARLEGYLADDRSSPSSQAERQERLLRLAAALDQLPEDQREAVLRHDLLGMPVAQVACELGRTEKAIAGLLYRAKRRLGELLHDLK